jgi:hypothetical protein
MAFQRALRDVAGAQEKLLLHLLKQNANTEIGRRYGFATIRSVTEYQARVPLSTYDDYQEAIQRIGAGEHHVLTSDPVLLLELTSGSTAPTKQIPYTATLKAEFQRAIAPWIVNLYSQDPDLLSGQAYWSITPVTRGNKRTSGGISIGFEEDSEYFGGLRKYLIHSVLAVPPMVRLIDDLDAFRYVTLLFLLRSRSLTLISVWNPTFLTLLVERLSNWWKSLADDIYHGTVSPPAPMAESLLMQFRKRNRPNPCRAEEIRDAVQTTRFAKETKDPKYEKEETMGQIHARLWPCLRLISCWTDAHAALYAPELARLFPQARLQGKGLIATEGFVSFPKIRVEGAVLAIRSHFFEFLPVANRTTEVGGYQQLSSTPSLPAHELKEGHCYSVVLTTGGGLYRYRLNDVVRVVGHLETCPLIRFVGKEAYISDYFGEKLNEYHVRETLDALLSRYAVQTTFVMLACELQCLARTGQRPAYVLFIQAESESDDTLRLLGMELEIALQQNYHYKYCRDLGQLDTLHVFRIERNAMETYLSVCQNRSQRLGDIKPVALHRLEGWLQAFCGRII